MATYTKTPRTFTSGETLTAANLNADLRDFILAFGAANSYTPTLTGFTAGNGVATGEYWQVGKLVAFRAQFTLGSTSAAASAAPTLTLPVTAAAAVAFTLSGEFADTGTGFYVAAPRLASTTAVACYALSTGGLGVNCSTTSPFTWASTDVIRVGGVYQAA